MVTTSSPFRVIDLYTVQVHDLTFNVPFEITAERDDYIHAFVCYFDIEFTKCHKPVVFSCGPQDPYTHWKQTVFYLHNHLVINKGEKIKGTFSLAPNASNPRDIDLIIKYQFKGKNGEVDTEHSYKMC
jgi:protein arginine N-methyltransferase 1